MSVELTVMNFDLILEESSCTNPVAEIPQFAVQSVLVKISMYSSELFTSDWRNQLYGHGKRQLTTKFAIQNVLVR